MELLLWMFGRVYRCLQHIRSPCRDRAELDPVTLILSGFHRTHPSLQRTPKSVITSSESVSGSFPGAHCSTALKAQDTLSKCIRHGWITISSSTVVGIH